MPFLGGTFQNSLRRGGCLYCWGGKPPAPWRGRRLSRSIR